MKPSLVKLPTHNSKPPNKCLVTGRRDGEVVDFGRDYVGVDPHVYIRRHLVEEAARELCGMVKEEVAHTLEDELREANAEAGRLRAIVAGKEDLSAAEARLRAALTVGEQKEKR